MPCGMAARMPALGCMIAPELLPAGISGETHTHIFRIQAPSGHPSVRHPSRRGHAHAMQARRGTFHQQYIFHANLAQSLTWTARPGGSPLPCSRRGIVPPFAQQNGQHILLQVTDLVAANTTVLVAQYRPVCHEPFGAVRAAQSSALKCVRRHHKSMVRVVFVSDFCLQGCTQQLRHDVCA